MSFCISELVIIFWCHNCVRIFLFYFSWVITRYKLLFSEQVKWSLAYVWMLHEEASIYFFLHIILKPCSGSKLPSSPYLSLSPFFYMGRHVYARLRGHMVPLILENILTLPLDLILIVNVKLCYDFKTSQMQRRKIINFTNPIVVMINILLGLKLFCLYIS